MTKQPKKLLKEFLIIAGAIALHDESTTAVLRPSTLGLIEEVISELPVNLLGNIDKESCELINTLVVSALNRLCREAKEVAANDVETDS